MYKLIVFLVAAIPVVLFLRTLFARSPKMKKATAELSRHIDYLVWAILAVIGVALVYTIGQIIYSMWQ